MTATYPALRVEHEQWKSRIYDLSDRDLVIALYAVAQRAEALELPIDQWSIDFGKDLAEKFRERPSITWRQRRKARQILIDAAVVLDHRVLIDRELEDALKRSS